MTNADYAVGDEVTVEYDDEGEMDTLTGVITGFHDVDGERGFWLKYTVGLSDGLGTFIEWWRLGAIKEQAAPIGSTENGSDHAR
jgi:hypothetical protein